APESGIAAGFSSVAPLPGEGHGARRDAPQAGGLGPDRALARHVVIGTRSSDAGAHTGRGYARLSVDVVMRVEPAAESFGGLETSSKAAVGDFRGFNKLRRDRGGYPLCEAYLHCYVVDRGVVRCQLHRPAAAGH